MLLHKKNRSLTLLVLLLISVNFWAQAPPELSATGNQAYCPESEINIVTDFDIFNPDAEVINAIYIQISVGYINGQDRLELTGNHRNITPKTFNTQEGKLELDWTGTGTPNDNDLIAAVKDVLFESTSNNPIDKEFSITIGTANYLPSTGHYYEYVSSVGITWTNAKIAAEGRNYYGLQGYLATITSADEAQLTGEQAAGAGWIGGSDEAVEGTWKWVTGPENGMIFWNGLANGSSPPGVYSNWNTGEPNQAGNEDYAHVTAPNVGILGSWNDLSNTGEPSGDFQPKGYIVEYGSMPGDPPLDLSASTKIYVPKIDSTTPGENCGTGTVTLSANATVGDVLWFNSLTSTTPISKGTTYTTPSISSTTTYYVLASENDCITGVRTSVIATIKTIPTITNSSGTTICGAGSGTLTATASAGIINWYANANGGASIGTGTTFITPVETTTTTYYVDATDNGCTTLTRTPVTLNVQYTNPPSATSPQTFCDIENATLNELTITGTNVLWYADAIGGISLPTTTLLIDNRIYYASQTENTCESSTRTPVTATIYETVVPLLPADIPIIEECDSNVDGDDTSGFTEFDLTKNEATLLNGKNASDFTFSYFTDSNYLPISEIATPTNFENTIVNGQTIYTRILNNADPSCFTDESFLIKVNPLPTIKYSDTLKNCDEDGTPDGFTDFNLNAANPSITLGDASLIVSYYLSTIDANLGVNPVNPSPFSNSVASTVYARIENSFGCHRVATVTLEVSTTHFPNGYMQQLTSCDDDATIDGLATFDLTQASPGMIAQFPTGQNLTVHYYRNATDAQLGNNEILPQNNYINEVPYNQVIYVRVESEDNQDCYGIGPHLTLIVNPRPEFEVLPTAIVCLNLPPITLETFNPQDVYLYQWYNDTGTVISNLPTATVSSGGVYSVLATSTSFGCESFLKTVTVSESEIASITLEDITIKDDSSNNIIEIDNANNNLGIGEYEFALDDEFGFYQDAPIFEMVPAGVHTIYVKDINACGTTSIDVSVIGYPNFFTPNYDGYNDTWQVLGVSSEFYPTSRIYIFDRFGKLITQIDPTGEGWDGLYNNVSLPATDYWFSVQLIDNQGNIREKKGHFSLIR